jgi:xanthine dehydrogenase accessory factor
VGMIGSANKIALMRKKFIDEGLATPLQWDAIHAPVGIEIRSKTVQEIAVSIAAQLVQVRNHKVTAHA